MTNAREIELGELMPKEGRVSVNPADYPGEVFELLSIPSYDRGSAEIALGSEIGSTKQAVQPGDVLLSKIVPHIRRAWVVEPSAGSRQIASSEWIVFRSKEADSRYLRHFLVSDGFHRQFMQTVSGVGGSLLRARPKYVAKIRIPLPPLEEQRRIAAILDKASEIKALNNAFAFRLHALIQSLFSRVGDPLPGDDVNHEVISLGKLLAQPLRNGVSPSSHGTYKCRVLTLSAITRGSYRPEASKSGFFAQEPTEDKKVCSDDFLICRGNGNLSLVGLGEFPIEDDADTVFPDTMIAARLREDLVDKMYLSIAWKQVSIRRQIESLARTTNGTAKVNQAALESIELSLPLLRAQEGFSLLYGRSKQMLKSCESIEGCLEKLTSSLQHQFFKS